MVYRLIPKGYDFFILATRYVVPQIVHIAAPVPAHQLFSVEVLDGKAVFRRQGMVDGNGAAQGLASSPGFIP